MLFIAPFFVNSPFLVDSSSAEFTVFLPGLRKYGSPDEKAMAPELYIDLEAGPELCMKLVGRKKWYPRCVIKAGNPPYQLFLVGDMHETPVGGFFFGFSYLSCKSSHHSFVVKV